MPDVEFGSAEFWSMDRTYMVAAATALVLFGGLMSGLTLGLLSAEELELSIVERAGTATEQRRAIAVRGLIKRQHLLLVTLLLCNAAAMEALPLVLDRLLSPIGAVLISVTAVLAFGEILPQAVCKAYGLAVGSAAAPLVRCLLVLCWPIAWPISKLLDCVLGHDEGHFFAGAEMAAALDIHRERGHLSREEADIMQGALCMAQKRCQDCMTPIGRVQSLATDALLDEATMDWIVQTGHSRIPVHEPGKPGKFLGVLLIKKLIKLRPEDAWPVSTQRLSPLVKVVEDEPLYKILDIFQTGQTHMAVVYPRETELGDNLAPLDVPPLGILTLEDLIEELINEEIVDETDLYIDVAHEEAGVAEELRGAERLRAGRLVCAPAVSFATRSTASGSDQDISMPERRQSTPAGLGRVQAGPAGSGEAEGSRRRATGLQSIFDLAQAQAKAQAGRSPGTESTESRPLAQATRQRSVRTVARTPLLKKRTAELA
ncbi:CBSDUF5 [Symbiodinium sp. KB8]|nr:CBSDUF5 [Symbiodinium sp. KB8]